MLPLGPTLDHMTAFGPLLAVTAGTMSGSSAKTRQSSPVRKPRILLVDDEPAVLRGLCRVLSSAETGFQVLTAKDGQEALDVLKQRRIDVVITDLSMPRMNGLSLLLQMSTLCPETIRIVHSSHLETLGPELVSYLAHNVLSKPANSAELLAMARWALHRYRTQTGKPDHSTECA